MPSAFAAMRQGPVSGTVGSRITPTIVFHGDRDTTVSPTNADAVVAGAMPRTTLDRRTSKGQVPGGHAYEVITHLDRDGRSVIEQWRVHGAAHAWFGGSVAGSYTDPKGPDATREMVRFFLAHRLPQAA